MRIYLIRHADAVAEGPTLPDWQRCLDQDGREQARALGLVLCSHAAMPSCVLTSPLMRAVQTAELVAAALGFQGMIESLPYLAPGADVAKAAARLRERSESMAGSIMAVGHEPGLSALAGVLCDGPPPPGLRKAQAGCIDDGAPAFILAAGTALPLPWQVPHR